METSQRERQIVKYSSFREACAVFQNRLDLDHNDLFYQAILEALEEAAEQEGQGRHVDPSTIFDVAIKKAEALVAETLVVEIFSEDAEEISEERGVAS